MLPNKTNAEMSVMPTMKGHATPGDKKRVLFEHIPWLGKGLHRTVVAAADVQ